MITMKRFLRQLLLSHLFCFLLLIGYLYRYSTCTCMILSAIWNKLQAQVKFFKDAQVFEKNYKCLFILIELHKKNPVLT